MSIILIIIIVLIFMRSKYKETEKKSHLYAKAFGYFGMPDNSNWWLGENHSKNRSEISIIMFIVFILHLLFQESDSLGLWDEYLTACVICMVFIYISYKIYKESALPRKPNYSIMDIKIVMDDFRNNKRRLKELVNLSNIENENLYLDSLINEAETKWLEAYNNGYY